MAILILLLSRQAVRAAKPTASQAFDFKDPKEISAVSLAMESKLEPIFGYAKGLSGTVTFDPARPAATTGRIAVDVATVQFANDGYTSTARGPAGLDGSKYPQIFFTLRKVLRVDTLAPNVFKAKVLADFTCHGITTPLVVPVAANYYPGAAEERTNGKFKGDVLVLRTQFVVSRTRQGISAGIPIALVGDDIEVRVSVVGLHYAATSKPSALKKTAPKLAAVPTLAPEAGAGVKPHIVNTISVNTDQTWQIEVEDRDDPKKAMARFDFTAVPPTGTLQLEADNLILEDVQRNGSRLTFRLPANTPEGSGEASATLTGDTLQGEVHLAKETLRFHGRRKQATAIRLRTIVPTSATAQGFGDLKLRAGDKETTLPERMAFHHTPALAIARMENYRVVETGAWGVTNVETGQPVNEATLFQAGDMGSPLVNVAALRLAAAKQLDLTRPANTYLKRWQIPENEWTRRTPITVADLIKGTSGLTQYKFVGYRPEARIPTLTALLSGADTGEIEPVLAQWEPGTKASEGMGGINPTVLQQVLEEATGKPFAELMQETVFTPLGMTHSTYAARPDQKEQNTIAWGHYASGDLMLDGCHIYPELAASGLWTTASDWAILLCEVQKLMAGKPNRILADDQRNLLGSFQSKATFLGWLRGERGGYYHGGDPYGYFANVWFDPAAGRGIVTMQNRMGGWFLHNEVVAAVKRRHGWDNPGADKAQ